MLNWLKSDHIRPVAAVQDTLQTLLMADCRLGVSRPVGTVRKAEDNNNVILMMEPLSREENVKLWVFLNEAHSNNIV